MNCLFMEPIWQEIQDELDGLAIENFDADDDAETHKKFNIKDVPTTIFINDGGNEIFRFEGIKEKEELKKIINEHLIL